MLKAYCFRARKAIGQSRQGTSLIRFHAETLHCHSEPPDRLRMNFAKNLPEGNSNQETLRRPAICGTPQNDKGKGRFPNRQ